MSTHLATCHLPDETAATRWARAWGACLGAGDVVLLSGGIGAGKTHFARGLIQSRLPIVEDVPSPTFTLVQVYETESCEIWHCDLYRVTNPLEVIELGLDDAMQDAICLIEWPDRMGTMAPDTAITLHFTPQDDARRVEITGRATHWANRIPACPT